MKNPLYLGFKCYCGLDISWIKNVNKTDYFACSGLNKHFSMMIKDNQIEGFVLRTQKHELASFKNLNHFKLNGKDTTNLVVSVEDAKNILSDPDRFIEHYLILS